MRPQRSRNSFPERPFSFSHPLEIETTKRHKHTTGRPAYLGRQSSTHSPALLWEIYRVKPRVRVVISATAQAANVYHPKWMADDENSGARKSSAHDRISDMNL